MITLFVTSISDSAWPLCEQNRATQTATKETRWPPLMPERVRLTGSRCGRGWSDSC